MRKQVVLSEDEYDNIVCVKDSVEKLIEYLVCNIEINYAKRLHILDEVQYTRDHLNFIDKEEKI